MLYMENSSLFELIAFDRDKSIAIDFGSKSKILLMAFGGMAGKIGMPQFEFFKLASKIRVKKMFVRDMNRKWYHNGMPGIAENIDGVSDYLLKIIKSVPINRIVVVGNSMGGYAALLFGWLLRANQVHAFAPKTFINPIRRFLHGDIAIKSWKRMLSLQLDNSASKEYFDLAKVLYESNGKTEYHIHYCQNNRIDRLHAKRMEKLPNFIMHTYMYGGHNLVKTLRDTGELKKILFGALQPESVYKTQTGEHRTSCG